LIPDVRLPPNAQGVFQRMMGLIFSQLDLRTSLLNSAEKTDKVYYERAKASSSASERLASFWLGPEFRKWAICS